VATQEQENTLRGTESAAALAGGGAAGLDGIIEIESPSLGEGTEPVRARGYWEQVWRRFKRDKVAIGSGCFVIFLFLVCFGGAPIAAHFLGHGPNDLFTGGGLDKNLLPKGPLSWVETLPYPGATGHFPKTFFVLGADSQLGRDEFLRLLYGGQTSLEVAVGATMFSMALGVLMGAIAGYFGGWLDTLISRLTEIAMAFPILLFTIALASTAGPRLNGITLGFLAPGVLTLVIIFSIFGWFYPARIVRAQILSLREKEFVEAARMVGASDWKIIRSHLLPHLVAPVIVLSTITVAQFILAEAGFSFLGVGIPQPTASWGSLLERGPDYYLTQPWLMVWPGLAVLLTTLAFNLLGDGLRDAFDPRGTSLS
jgi:ABC-type dipeptide/oligopeptide/nickel transport system permease subunit